MRALLDWQPEIQKGVSGEERLTKKINTLCKQHPNLGMPSKLKKGKFCWLFWKPLLPPSFLTFYKVNNSSGPKFPLGIFCPELKFTLLLKSQQVIPGPLPPTKICAQSRALVLRALLPRISFLAMDGQIDNANQCYHKYSDYSDS